MKNFDDNYNFPNFLNDDIVKNFALSICKHLNLEFKDLVFIPYKKHYEIKIKPLNSNKTIYLTNCFIKCSFNKSFEDKLSILLKLELLQIYNKKYLDYINTNIKKEYNYLQSITSNNYSNEMKEIINFLIK